jgi:hypothetical protein
MKPFLWMLFGSVVTIVLALATVGAVAIRSMVLERRRSLRMQANVLAAIQAERERQANQPPPPPAPAETQLRPIVFGWLPRGRMD